MAILGWKAQIEVNLLPDHVVGASHEPQFRQKLEQLLGSRGLFLVVVNFRDEGVAWGIGWLLQSLV
jgi:hypothetical protein